MKVFVVLVLVLVALTACNADVGPRTLKRKEQKEDTDKDSTLIKVLLVKLLKDVEIDETKDYKRCHLGEKIEYIISKNEEKINKLLTFFHKNVADVTQVYLFRIRYEIDHLLIHLSSYLKSLKLRLFVYPKTFESKFQNKLEDLKSDADYHSAALDFKGLKAALGYRIAGLKELLQKDVKRRKFVLYKEKEEEDSDDVKKLLEDALEKFYDKLSETTDDYEQKVYRKTYSLFGEKKKKEKSKKKRSFSCNVMREKVDSLWHSICEKYH